MIDEGKKARDSASGRVSGVFIVVASTFAVLNALGLVPGLRDSTFVILGTASVFCTLYGLRHHRPKLRWPWWTITVALGLFVAGGAARATFGGVGDLTAHRSLIPDSITIPGYLLFGAGLSAIATARRRGQEGNLDTLLDALVAAMAAMALAWVYLITPNLVQHHAPLPVRVVLVAYPSVSVFMVSAIARIAFSPSTRRVPAFQLLMAAMACMLLGDVLYILVEPGVLIPPLWLLDLPYAFAFILFSGCVAHPSMATLCEPVSAEEAVPSQTRMNMVALALCVPSVVMLTRAETTASDRIALSAVVITLTGLASYRVLRALRAHARSEERLAHQAMHDHLTGLPNQLVIREALSEGFAEGRREQMAILFVDLDRFKLVNDTHGHSFGDELLVAVAARLRGVDEAALVARVGGDEFVLVLRDIGSRSAAIAIAERVRHVFGEPFRLGTAEVYSSASVGIAFAMDAGPEVDAEDMIRDADTAMYEAKAHGRDSVAVFDPAMRERVTERLGLESDLRRALENRELRLAYQPVIRYPAGPIDSVEALARWNHETWGDVSPTRFVPVAEDTGLIVELGHWVIREACSALAGWRRTLPGAEHLQVGINLSARQFRDPTLLEVIQQALLDNDLPAEAVCLELTESLLIDEPETATELLSAFHALGIRLAIDDFGTGYSSLAYLKRFPVDVVKIDRSFVEGLNRADSSDETLVAAIVAMAGAMSMTTIAEGVETPAQETKLIGLGCDAGQGFLYCRPIPAEEIPAVLRRIAATESSLPSL
ncbi:MAG: EAL domain-containing protein [Acidobacteria bacterium]|nr:EAL domain-containing protein [Acidobacteriota bacterium]